MKIIILSRVKKCQFSWICNHHSMRSRLLTMNSGTHHASSPFLALFSRNYILTHACMHKIVCIGFWLAKLQNHIATVQSPPPNNTHLTPQQLDIVLTEAPLNTENSQMQTPCYSIKQTDLFSYLLLSITWYWLIVSLLGHAYRKYTRSLQDWDIFFQDTLYGSTAYYRLRFHCIIKQPLM